MNYEFTAIEEKWQKIWEDKKLYQAVNGSDKPKFYGLVEFPYPSGGVVTPRANGKVFRGAEMSTMWPTRSTSWINREPPRDCGSRKTAMR